MSPAASDPKSDPSEAPDDRRRRRRFVVVPRYQLQFAALLVIFQFNVGIVYQGVLQGRIRELAERSGSMRNFQDLNLWSETLPWMLGLSAVISVFVYLMGLYFSNSIVGPIPRLRRVLQRLADGDYTARLKFRPGDALEVLAQDVNHLAKRLQARHAVAGNVALANATSGAVAPVRPTTDVGPIDEPTPAGAES